VNVEQLLGKEVTGFAREDGVEVPLEEMSEVTDSEYYSLTTNYGKCSIELRVNHNGYYGGWFNGPTLVDNWTPEDGKHRKITKDTPFRE